MNGWVKHLCYGTLALHSNKNVLFYEHSGVHRTIRMFIKLVFGLNHLKTQNIVRDAKHHGLVHGE